MERHRQTSVACGALLAMSMAAGAGAAVAAQSSAIRAPVQPRVVSEPVRHDTDDPAIWVDPADPARTLIVGTDKDIDGALYVFGLDGRIKQERVVRGLLFRSDTVVPFGRVQHIDVNQGPLERFFGIATLTLHTAGNHNASVSLPGLGEDLAREMRETIRAHIRRETV